MTTVREKPATLFGAIDVQAVRNIRHQAGGATPSDGLDPVPARRERRGTFRAMAAWAGLAGEGGVPALSTLLGQHPAISGQEFLLKADLIPRFSVFILCGDTMTALLGQSVLGATLWECMPQQVRNTLSETCAAALSQGAPVQEEGDFEIDAGAAVRFRGVFLPLRSDKRASPNYLFGAYGSRIFETTAPATT